MSIPATMRAARMHAVGGPMSMAELTRKSKLPAALLQRALGWLAREGKVRLTHDKLKEVIALHR